MKLTTIFSTLMATILLASCATVKVDKIDPAHLAKYKKFAWVTPDTKSDASNVTNGITDQDIQTAVKTEFAKKGIMEDDKNPDFLVMYHIVTKQKAQEVANNPAPIYPYFGYGFGPRGYYYHNSLYPIVYGGYYNPWNTGYHVEEYTDGTLIIDVLDSKSHELVWRGSIENPVGGAEGLAKQFAKESKEILAKYPDVK